MSWLSSWLNKSFGIPEIHITTAEAVNAAVSAAKVTLQDELSGKVESTIINDLVKSLETSAEQILTAHVAAATAAAP